MDSFSQRKGLTPSKAIQRESMDEHLRNCLWAAIDACLFKGRTFDDLSMSPQVDTDFLNFIWTYFFKKRSDRTPFYDFPDILYKYVFSCAWYQVYELLEFMANYLPEGLQGQFILNCNFCLERESSAYRFVSNQITDINSQEEIQEIEEAIDHSEQAIKTHLQTALKFLSDRKAPDYRNSIKESISAVEAVCRKITGQPKATLSSALETIEQHCDLHGALKDGLKKIYGYTSDEQGVRHALCDNERVTFADAKFMLVLCSAFVNFLTAKQLEKKR